MEGRDDKPLKHILEWNAGSAPDPVCTEVGAYLAAKQALLPTHRSWPVQIRRPSTPGGTTNQPQGPSHSPMQKRENMWTSRSRDLLHESRTSDSNFLSGPEFITDEELLDEFERFERQEFVSRRRTQRFVFPFDYSHLGRISDSFL
jgi:hypothetical protein